MTNQITSDNLSYQIANRLRDDILAGRIQPGQRISEKALVERFAVSRTPIREALAQLSQEGLLTARANCGVTVAPVASTEIRDLVLPIRKTLEAFALRSIFEELHEDDFRAFEEILSRMREACENNDAVGTAECDIAFHRSIIGRSGLPDLMAVWSVIVVRLRSHFWYSHLRYDDLMDVYREHREIVEMFRGGNVDAAVGILTGSMSLGQSPGTGDDDTVGTRAG